MPLPLVPANGWFNLVRETRVMSARSWHCEFTGLSANFALKPKRMSLLRKFGI
jgi:hypothetical protein